MIAEAQSPSPRRPKSDEPRPAGPLRLPEDRAFDVATINARLARMAERAAPRRPSRS
jgi:hypothetical protein